MAKNSISTKHSAYPTFPCATFPAPFHTFPATFRTRRGRPVVAYVRRSESLSASGLTQHICCEKGRKRIYITRQRELACAKNKRCEQVRNSQQKNKRCSLNTAQASPQKTVERTETAAISPARILAYANSTGDTQPRPRVIQISTF